MLSYSASSRNNAFDDLHFPNAPNIVVEPPGPNAKALLEKQKLLEGRAVLYPLSIPLVPGDAKGATIRDVDGNVYIDLAAGISVANFGHSNPYILHAAEEQLRRMAHTLDFPSKPREDLAERLVGIAPGDLKGNCKVLFGGPTGSDAVEAAVKLAKLVTKRSTVMAFTGSYHGQTSMALNLSATRKFKEPFVPLAPEVHFAPYPYCYRCPFKLSYPECKLACMNYFENLIEDPYSGVPKPSAVIVEPVQGEGGIVVPPKEFLPRLKEIAKKHGILLIADEIQSGMGRTGKWFACEHFGVTPDVITLSKSVGGIGLPLSAMIYRRDLDIWEPGAHAGTFRGNVIAMAAGSAALDFANKHGLLSHASKLGDAALKFLKDLAEGSRHIGDVRGLGLMLAIELVKDKANKEPYPELATAIQKEAFKRGVVVWKAGGYGNVIRLLPPLVITEDLLMRSLDIVSETIKSISSRM